MTLREGQNWILDGGVHKNESEDESYMDGSSMAVDESKMAASIRNRLCRGTHFEMPVNIR